MARVTGIGGVFIRSTDRVALSQWYRDILGVTLDADHVAIISDTPDTYSVFAFFDATSSYIGSPTRQNVMVNFRVDDLVELRDEMMAKGVTVEAIAHEEYGLFCWTHDPDGRRIELWQPTP